ncbi:hypothetical protein PENSPDRAFT_215635 [Peniophora sp. CONT]|nr:hypothetical protein PENSPDRAFT_215635 [Peniophora sp. CONT]
MPMSSLRLIRPHFSRTDLKEERRERLDLERVGVYKLTLTPIHEASGRMSAALIDSDEWRPPPAASCFVLPLALMAIPLRDRPTAYPQSLAWEQEHLARPEDLSEEGCENAATVQLAAILRYLCNLQPIILTVDHNHTRSSGPEDMFPCAARHQFVDFVEGAKAVLAMIILPSSALLSFTNVGPSFDPIREPTHRVLFPFVS